MRISGTLLDRLLIRLFPIAALLGSILYFTTSTYLLDFTKTWTLMLIIVWIFDGIFLVSKRIKRLSIIDDKLKIGDDIIESEDLLSINKLRDERRGTVIRTIELEYLKNNMLIKAQIITKPTLGDFLGRKTKTIDILKNKFPDVKAKIFGEV